MKAPNWLVAEQPPSVYPEPEDNGPGLIVAAVVYVFLAVAVLAWVVFA